MPAASRHVLEIGCGGGELAERLAADGLELLAIDTDAACIEAARGRGADALVLEWPAQLHRKFDAILFTRSLHHIHDLDESVRAARTALRDGGRLIVEDFRSEGVSAPADQWYCGLTQLLHAIGALVDGADLETLLAAPQPGDHHLHSSMEIAAALSCFTQVHPEDSAYFFRYLEASVRSPEAAAELLGWELSMIGCHAIGAPGRRFVAFAE